MGDGKAKPFTSWSHNSLQRYASMTQRLLLRSSIRKKPKHYWKVVDTLGVSHWRSSLCCHKGLEEHSEDMEASYQGGFFGGSLGRSLKAR